MKRDYLIVLFAIFLIGAVLRVTGIASFPALLTQDEASIAYNAWSIVSTGKDEWGKSFPLIFDAFGDAKQPGMVYATAIWMKLFGWSYSGVRVVSALAGIVAMVAITWLVWNKTRKTWLVITAAVITATSPWLIHLSRLGLESNLALAFFSVGILAWQIIQHNKLSPNKRLALLLLAAITLAASTYTYVAYRLVVPLLLIWWSISTVRSNPQLLRKPKAIYAKAPILLIALITLIAMSAGLFLGSTTRFDQVGILRADSINAPLIELRNGCHLASFQHGLPAARYGCVLLWNQITMPVWLVGQSYLNHLSPDFWFISGDKEIYRNPNQSGAFYVVLFPLFLFGWLAALKSSSIARLGAAGFLIGIIASTLTDLPQAIRLSPAAPFVVLLMIGGVIELQKMVKKGRLVIPVVIGLTIISLITTIPLYLTNSFIHSHTWLGYGKQVAQESNKLVSKGKTVVISPDVIPEAHIFYAYWNQIDPQLYQSWEKSPRIDELGFRRPTRLGEQFIIDRIDYRKDLCAPDILSQDLALIVPADDLIDFPAEAVIKNESDIHTMARIIVLEDSEEMEQAIQIFCLPATDRQPHTPQTSGELLQ